MMQNWADKVDESHLRSLADEICVRHEVSQQIEFSNKFLSLAKKHRQAIDRLIRSGLPPDLGEVKKHAKKLSVSLRNLNAESRQLLPDLFTDEFPELSLTCDALASLISKMFESDNEIKAIKELTTKRFVKLCLDFSIPITWSKEIDCCPNASAHLLAAVFSAEKCDLADEVSSANYYISKLSKGFLCKIDGWVARINFDQVTLEPDPFVSEMVSSFLEGRPPLLRTKANTIGQASVHEHDLSLGYPERKLVLGWPRRLLPWSPS